MPAPIRLLFIRHGESDANRRGVIAGWLDAALTDFGHQQARHSAALLAGRPLRHVYASPQRRALDTARHVARGRGVRIEIVEGLRERAFGRLEGGPVDAVADHFSVHPPGGESWPQFAARVRTAIARLPLLEDCALVAHAGVFRVLAEWCEGVRRNERPPNAGVFSVDTSQEPPITAVTGRPVERDGGLAK